MKKELNRKDLFAIALGSVIGWGAFVLPGNVFLPNAGVVNTLIGFLIAVIMIFFIEKSYSILLRKYPSVGGEYTFAKNIFGKKMGFSTGWLLTIAYLSIIPLNATAIPMVLESITDWYSPGVLLYKVAGYDVYFNDLVISLCIIIFFTSLNFIGLKSSKFAQNLSVLSLIISLFLILIFSLFSVEVKHYENFQSNFGEVDFSQIIRIIAFAPWAFIGFDTVAQMSEEFKVDGRKASFSAFIAVVFGALVYNLLNIITAFGVADSELSDASWATGSAVLEILGPFALDMLAIAMFGAVISGLNGFFMGSSRLLYAIVKSEANNDRSITIKRMILIIGILSCAVPFFGRNALTWFVDISSVGASFAYLITCLGAYKTAETFKYKVYTLLGAIFSALFLVFLLTPWFGSNIPAISALCLFLWVVLGFVIYCRLNYFNKKREISNDQIESN